MEGVLTAGVGNGQRWDGGGGSSLERGNPVRQAPQKGPGPVVTRGRESPPAARDVSGHVQKILCAVAEVLKDAGGVGDFRFPGVEVVWKRVQATRGLSGPTAFDREVACLQRAALT